MPEHPWRRLYWLLQSFKHCFSRLHGSGGKPGISGFIGLKWSNKEGRAIAASLDNKARHSALHVTALQQGPSATHFCAADAQWSPHACSLAPNLQLQRRATPAVGTTAVRLFSVPGSLLARKILKWMKKRGIFNFYFLYWGHFLKIGSLSWEYEVSFFTIS